jgi:actin-related protein
LDDGSAEGGTQMPPGFPSRTKDDLREIMPPRFVPNMVSSFNITLKPVAVDMIQDSQII